MRDVRRSRLPSLRRELVLGLTVLLMAALALGTAAMLTFLQLNPTASVGQIVGYLAIVMVLDVLILAAYGHHKLSHLVLRPVDDMVAGAERVAGGDFEHRLDESVGAEELARLASSVNAMAERLIQNQRALEENVRSLEETNQELTQARDELIRAEKLASVGRLAAGIAHEVGNPLGAIRGYVDVAKRRGQLDDEMYEGLKREAIRIDRIVRGLLDYARPRQAATRPLDVNEVVRQVVDLLETQGRFKAIRVDLHLANRLPAVRGDPTQLEQVLVNLLLNAAESVTDAGSERIEVSTLSDRHRIRGVRTARRRDDPPGVDYSHIRRFHRVPGSEWELAFRDGERLVKIVVRDDGAGIPAEILGRIFEPFFTTKDPGRGTGLGLAVASRLVEGMGGVLEAANADGGGAAFTVLLPAVGDVPAAESETAAESEARE